MKNVFKLFFALLISMSSAGIFAASINITNNTSSGLDVEVPLGLQSLTDTIRAGQSKAFPISSDGALKVTVYLPNTGYEFKKGYFSSDAAVINVTSTQNKAASIALSTLSDSRAVTTSGNGLLTKSIDQEATLNTTSAAAPSGTYTVTAQKQPNGSVNIVVNSTFDYFMKLRYAGY